MDFWEKVYEKNDIGGQSVFRRMQQTLEWFDGLDLPRDAAILDAGAGVGFLSREILSRGYGVFAMDYSFGMLEKTRNLCDHNGKQDVGLAQADIEAIPFKDSSLDVVISLGVLSYLKTVEKAMREFARVLKPDGTLIFSTLNKINIVGYFDVPAVIRNAAKKIFGKKKKAGRMGEPGVSRASSSRRLFFTPGVVKSMKESGFMEVTYETIPFRLLTFGGKTIPPERLNTRIVLLLEKLPSFPVIGPLGGLCVFRAKKKTGDG